MIKIYFLKSDLFGINSFYVNKGLKSILLYAFVEVQVRNFPL
jgi:hypothetical protein